MKKYLTTLITFIIVTLAAIQTEAAELESQLLGYWQPDMAKTVELAKKEKREIDPMKQAIMGKMVFEIQKDKMIVHGPSGMKTNAPPASYVISGVDKATNSLTLTVGEKNMKASFQDTQLVLNDPIMGPTIYNRMSNEDFAKRQAKAKGLKGKAGEVGKESAEAKPEDASAQPILDKPAAGKINGKEFKVEKATLKLSGLLELRQGKDFFADLAISIFLFKSNGSESVDNFDGKKIEVIPGGDFRTTFMTYKVEGRDLPKTDIFNDKCTMYLEFGTAKDGKIPGKINLRLPDEAGSFVIGSFEAAIEVKPPELEDVSKLPIPDKPAAGKVDGKVFKVEHATLKGRVLELRQGNKNSSFADFKADVKEFKIDLTAETNDKLEGATFTVKPEQDSHISTEYWHRKGFLKLGGYTMKLEFGTAKKGKLPGKIHLRRQGAADEAGDFFVGTFEAVIE